MMKKSSLTFLLSIIVLLGFTSSIYAHSKSIIPAGSSGFGFSLTGLYVQPDANDLEYAVYTQPLPAPAPTWEQHSVDTSYHPAFNLGAQYTLNDAIDTLNVDWSHLDTSDSDYVSARGSASVAPPYYYGPLAQALFNSSADGKAEFDLDNVNLVIGRSFNWGRRVQLHPFVGLGTAYIKQDLTSNYKGENSSGDAYNITSYFISKYMGVGSRIGIDTSVFLSHHFSLLAHLGGNILFGSMKSDSHFLSQGRDNPTAVSTSLANQSLSRIVPEFDSNLGLNYTFLFHSGSSLSIQAGYLLHIYFDGINQVEPTALVADQFNNGVIAVETSAQTQSNFDMNGPYVKFVLKFQ